MKLIFRGNDEEIIAIVRSILSGVDFRVETINEAVLVKLMENRGTPINGYTAIRDIEDDYTGWLEDSQ